MKKFRFLGIALAILILISASLNLGPFSVKPVSAATTNEKYQKFLICTDNETQYEYTGMHFTEEQMKRFQYDYYSAPIEGGPPLTPGPVLLSPLDGSTNLPVDWIIFSWTPFKENTKYIFVLANDAAIETHIISMSEVTVATYPYKYDGILDYNAVYFWQVMALDPTKSEWSPIFSFRTEAAGAAAPATAPSPKREAPPNPSALPTTPIVIMLMTLSAAVGIITWLLVTRGRRAK